MRRSYRIAITSSDALLSQVSEFQASFKPSSSKQFLHFIRKHFSLRSHENMYNNEEASRLLLGWGMQCTHHPLSLELRQRDWQIQYCHLTAALKVPPWGRRHSPQNHSCLHYVLQQDFLCYLFPSGNIYKVW